MLNRKILIGGVSVLFVITVALFVQRSMIGTGLVGLGAVENEVVQIEEENLWPNPDRDLYGTGFFIDENRNLIEKPITDAFADLPEMPEDFGKKIHFMNLGNFNSVALGLEEEYFK